MAGVTSGVINQDFKNEILAAMGDDLNTSKALAIIDDFVRLANEELDLNNKNKAKKSEFLANLNFIGELLGILQIDAFEYFQFGVSNEKRAYIVDLLKQRDEAKISKNYALADEIRIQLTNSGISIMDTPNGTVWEKI